MKISEKNTILGLGLISGGLDSLVASLILKLQNIEVVGLNFKSPFCTCDKAYRNAECGLNLYNEKMGIKTFFLQKGDDYLEIIRNPKFGYGKNLNPCIDCRIYLLKKAKKFAQQINADFIFTGEVLNQRPMSQNLKALKIVEKESGLSDQLLRPLSAKLLKPTIYEEQGIIDRSKLLKIKGRSRKIQLELARKYNLVHEYYACGGCLLTDKNFSIRVKDYLEHNKDPEIKDINFLKYGRHFRYNNCKIIVGRNELENSILLHIKNPNDLIMEANEVNGPITIIQGAINLDIIKIAAKITLRYSDLKNRIGTVLYRRNQNSINNQIIIEKGLDAEIKNYIL